MKTHEFLSALQNNPAKYLKFEYKPGLFVNNNYHITEIKNSTIDSVDCGGQTDRWNETIIQLWESPKIPRKNTPMNTGKAQRILEKVHSVKPMDPLAELKFEFGNPNFHTAHLLVRELNVQDDTLLVKLTVDKTDCKAREACGVPEKKDKEKVTAPCCAPSAGCC